MVTPDSLTPSLGAGGGSSRRPPPRRRTRLVLAIGIGLVWVVGLGLGLAIVFFAALGAGFTGTAFSGLAAFALIALFSLMIAATVGLRRVARGGSARLAVTVGVIAVVATAALVVSFLVPADRGDAPATGGDVAVAFDADEPDPAREVQPPWPAWSTTAPMGWNTAPLVLAVEDPNFGYDTEVPTSWTRQVAVSGLRVSANGSSEPGSEQGWLTARRPDGTAAWTSTSRDSAIVGMWAGDGRVYAVRQRVDSAGWVPARSSMMIVAHDARTGHELWWAQAWPGALVVAGDTVLVLHQHYGKLLVALDATTGAERWHADLISTQLRDAAKPSYAGEVEMHLASDALHMRITDLVGTYPAKRVDRYGSIDLTTGQVS